MNQKINAYATKEAKKDLEPYTYEEEIKENDVLVAVTHCGICHSDVHLADGDWGNPFPCIPGHEVIGIVEAIGEKVTNLKLGDKVGIGWHCDSCNSCEYCNSSRETLCSKSQATCFGHFGGFAEKIIANERFVIPIPKEMNSAKTAPLLCGGITVYNPLRTYAKKGDSVAIIGIGGLGHLALQFANKMGCEVTAISTNSNKEVEAKEFGAHNFLTTNPNPNSFDLILNTAHFSPDMQVYMASLKPEGTFVQLGASPDPLTIGAFNLIDGNKKVAGSGVGSPNMIKEMIEFANKNEVYAKVEVVSMKDVNEALNKTRNNQARYRVVLEN